MVYLGMTIACSEFLVNWLEAGEWCHLGTFQLPGVEEGCDEERGARGRGETGCEWSISKTNLELATKQRALLADNN